MFDPLLATIEDLIEAAAITAKSLEQKASTSETHQVPNPEHAAQLRSVEALYFRLIFDLEGFKRRLRQPQQTGTFETP